MSEWRDISTAPRDGVFVLTLPPSFIQSEFALTVGFAPCGRRGWKMEANSDGVFPSELRVRSCVVVIDPPASERYAGLGRRREQRLIRQFIPQSAVEALDEGTGAM